MTMTRIKRSLSLILCMVLIAAMALFTTGCSDNTQTNETTIEAPQTSAADVETTEAQPDEETTQEIVSDDVTVLGEGETVFTFTVTDKDGNETAFEIHTDKTIVGEALLELELIAGDMGDFGLYVKTVNGISADYETDGTYWAFYIDGEYAMSGVDTTEIAEGAVYSFKVEK